MGQSDEEATGDDSGATSPEDHSGGDRGHDSDFQPSEESGNAVEEGLEELSLDNLGAAYARAAARHDPDAFAPSEEIDAEGGDQSEADAGEEPEADSEQEETSDELVTPEAIIEGALFVGHPENEPLSEQRLASLIRDFTPEEVIDVIKGLNQSYRESGQGIRIVDEERGYRMTIAPEVEQIRRSFLGKVREARLSQAAIEVLALVAYQPGVDAQTVQDQRGRESGALLNQLVRRQLLSIERKKPEGGGRAVAHYYPTERFLVLFGIQSLDDLPQVEEGLREG